MPSPIKRVDQLQLGPLVSDQDKVVAINQLQRRLNEVIRKLNEVIDKVNGG
jgi:ArsR family metal-binding transcriptional regulator